MRAGGGSFRGLLERGLVEAGAQAQVDALARPLLAGELVVGVARQVVAEREPDLGPQLPPELEAHARPPDARAAEEAARHPRVPALRERPSRSAVHPVRARRGLEPVAPVGRDAARPRERSERALTERARAV